MKIVILAREHSERFPGKHLAMIGGEPMITGIVKRLSPFGDVILSTGPMKDNAKTVKAAADAGAIIYCEEEAPEWDLWQRIHNMTIVHNIKYWINYSGDCPFVDLRMLEPIWNELRTELWDVVSPQLTLNGLEGRAVSGMTSEYWDWLGRRLPEGDRDREHPWIKGGGTNTTVPCPWPQEKTRMKTSIDWPFEAAIADKIVRHLERWPKTDEDIVRCYREITTL